MRTASLFSGVGGIDLAAHWVGMETVVFCEKEPFCHRVLNKNFPGVPIIDDVFNFTRKELERLGILGPGRTIDLISIGDPCQPYSVAGNREGQDDDRFLWPEARRVLEEIRPRWIVRENVPGNISMGLDGVLTEMEDLGYACQTVVVPASAVGAVHKRERVFVVAYTDHGFSKSTDEEVCPGWASVVNGGSDVADTQGEQRDGAERSWRGQPGPADGREDVADTESQRFGNGDDSEDKRKTDREIHALANPGASAGEDVADAGGAGRQERDATAFAGGPGYGAGSGDAEHVADASDSGTMRGNGQLRNDDGSRGSRRDHDGGTQADDGGQRWPTESGMGGNPDEFPAELDGSRLDPDWFDDPEWNPLDALTDFIASYPQPAPLGMDQYEWEPPRVAAGVKNRAARLKAIGNAVDPLQILPILYAIRVINDWLKRR